MLNSNSASPNSGNILVVGSQSPPKKKTFSNCQQPFPTDIELYENYIQKRKEFDTRFGLLLKRKGLSEEQYYLSRHYYSLGIFD